MALSAGCGQRRSESSQMVGKEGFDFVDEDIMTRSDTL